MPRYYRRSRKNDDNEDDKNKIISTIFIFFIVSLVLAYYAGIKNFIVTLIIEVVIVLLAVWTIKEIKKKKEIDKRVRIEKILKMIKDAGLEDYINNFISRFGLGQEKDKNAWIRRSYKISWNRINDLNNFLSQRGINFSSQEICILLAEYVDKREFYLTVNSISSITNSFDKLNGSDFERLLYRLFEALGYSVQMTGRTGDQGGDLVATKGQERLLIQAKCYKDWKVGNSAVQEAAAARSHYDCNKAVVITTSVFTKEAAELAKTNGIDLISKNLLQKMLLDNLGESWN